MEILFSTYWKSSFSGGAGGGTGNRNYAARLDFGLVMNYFQYIFQN